MIHPIRLFWLAVAFVGLLYAVAVSAQDPVAGDAGPGAAELLSNPKKYPAFCYGGYRGKTRDQVPSVDDIKEDLKILSAMGVRILRTYNTQQFKHAENLLQAIKELGEADPKFEMYVMLGAWINCENAWSDQVNHDGEDVAGNTAEINAAVALADRFPGLVKVIAVGNEAMVHWASSYFVQPRVILRWVNHLQRLKRQDKLSNDIWITTSDNFAAWGGEGAAYHKEDLVSLIKAVDYVSLHTYPFHDTYHASEYWVDESPGKLSRRELSEKAVGRAIARAKKQYKNVVNYVASLNVDKPIHIGETGWATVSAGPYGKQGSGAADQYKSALFYHAMRRWTAAEGISCFYFEAFDEPWKDTGNPRGSENHFGLIDRQGRVKFALWKDFDEGVFEGLTRGGKPVAKSFSGDPVAIDELMLDIPRTVNFDGSLLTDVADDRQVGQQVREDNYLIFGEFSGQGKVTRPAAIAKLNAWEGTCGLRRDGDELNVETGGGVWWGCGIELRTDGPGENLELFENGQFHFEIWGDTNCTFTIGIQSGRFADGNQVSAGVRFGPDEKRSLTAERASWSVPVSQLTGDGELNLKDITTLLFIKGEKGFDEKSIRIGKVFLGK